MKKNIFLLVLPLLLCLTGCKKDDDQHTNPVDQLPPATQTGAGTFAALVDGKPFIDNSGGWFNCFYQFVDEGYYFNIHGKDESYKYTPSPWSLSLGTIDRSISEGEILELLEMSIGNASGGGGFSFSITDNPSSSTNTEYTGELTITKLDFEKQIVSGVFWFDLEHPETGERVKIREGRFDTLFTQ